MKFEINDQNRNTLLLFHHLTTKGRLLYKFYRAYWHCYFRPCGTDCKAVISYAHILHVGILLFCLLDLVHVSVCLRLYQECTRCHF